MWLMPVAAAATPLTVNALLCLGYLGFTECADPRPWVLCLSADVQAAALWDHRDVSLEEQEVAGNGADALLKCDRETTSCL